MSIKNAVFDPRFFVVIIYNYSIFLPFEVINFFTFTLH